MHPVPGLHQEVLPHGARRLLLYAWAAALVRTATQARQEPVDQSPVRVLGEALYRGSWGTALGEGQVAATEGGSTALGPDRGAVGLWELGVPCRHPPL